MKVGDVCLISEENVTRPNWPLGRIIKAIPSKNGLIRTYKLKTNSAVLSRPAQRLHLLEKCGDDCDNINDKQCDVSTAIQQTRRGGQDCTNDKPPQRGGAVPFPTLGRVEMACQFPEGLILGRFSLGQLFSFFIPAVQCAVTCGQHS